MNYHSVKDYNPYVEAFWKMVVQLKDNSKHCVLQAVSLNEQRYFSQVATENRRKPTADSQLGMNTNPNAPEKNWQQLIDFIKKNEDKNLTKRLHCIQV